MATAENILVNKILNLAAERKASDVHLTVGNYPVLRVDGKLITLTNEQIITPDFLNSAVDAFLTEEDKKKLASERDIFTVYDWANQTRFRAKIFYQKGYLAVSLRLIPRLIPTVKDLGLPPVIGQLITLDRGLMIVTGPFGSGRTTTVVSILETLNHSQGTHIQTLERPIEYLLANNQSVVEQRQVGRDTGSFLRGLQEISESDVDVVAVSELSENGMEEAILELAESGKLVIVVMNADSVVSALERFLSNIEADRRTWGQDILGQVLIGVIAQRLLPRLDGGLSLAYEILTSTPAVRSIIQGNRLAQLQNIMQTSKNEGMINLDKSLLNLVQLGEISVDDAKRQANDPLMFDRNFS